VIGVGSREAREFNASDESLLVAIARQLAATLEKVRLYEKVAEPTKIYGWRKNSYCQSEKIVGRWAS